MTFTASKNKMNRMLLKKIKDDYGIVIPDDVTIERFSSDKRVEFPDASVKWPLEISMTICKHVGNKSIAMQIEIRDE